MCPQSVQCNLFKGPYNLWKMYFTVSSNTNSMSEQSWFNNLYSAATRQGSLHVCEHTQGKGHRGYLVSVNKFTGETSDLLTIQDPPDCDSAKESRLLRKNRFNLEDCKNLSSPCTMFFSVTCLYHKSHVMIKAYHWKKKKVYLYLSLPRTYRTNGNFTEGNSNSMKMKPKPNILTVT